MYKFLGILTLLMIGCSENKNCFIVVENYSRGEHGSLITRIAYPAYSKGEATRLSYKLFKDNSLLDSLVADYYEVERLIYIKDCKSNHIQVIDKTVVEYVPE